MWLDGEINFNSISNSRFSERIFQSKEHLIVQQSWAVMIAEELNHFRQNTVLAKLNQTSKSFWNVRASGLMTKSGVKHLTPDYIIRPLRRFRAIWCVSVSELNKSVEGVDYLPVHDWTNPEHIHRKSNNLFRQFWIFISLPSHKQQHTTE